MTALVLLGLFLYCYMTPSIQSTQQVHEDTTSRLSYLDILDNPELKRSVQESLLTQDDELLGRIQNKALEIAKVANLPAAEYALLEGRRGRQLMIFRAKRQIFMQKFEEHYNQFIAIDNLKRAFPEAQDMFAKDDELITRRDQQIKAIAEELSGGQDVEAYVQRARDLWRARYQSEQ